MSLHEEEDNNPFSPPQTPAENSIHSAFQSTTVDDDGFTDLPLNDDEQSLKKNEGTTLGAPETKAGKSANDGNSPVVESDTKDKVNGMVQEKKKEIFQTTVAYDPDSYIAETSSGNTRSKPITSNTNITIDEDIEITEASKTHEGATRSYVVYTILFNSTYVRRRYSEFESLRKTLVKLHPTLIVPPIPKKQSLTKELTASVKGKGVDDASLVEYRRRMLAVFLKRCLSIDKLREDDVFQKFLDPNYNWSEVLKTPEILNLPKNPLLAHPISPVTETTPQHVHLPIPTNIITMTPATEVEKFFGSTEEKAKAYEELITQSISKTHKRVTKHLMDLSSEYTELGSTLNGFSLAESKDIASDLEHTGQCYDTAYLHTSALSTRLVRGFNEPITESTQFAGILRDLLKFRQLKSLQLDILTRSLKAKISKLRELEKLETEAQKLDQALKSNEGKTGKINFDRTKATSPDPQSQTQTQSPTQSPTQIQSQSQPSSSSSGSSKFKIPSLSSISTYISKTIDPSSAGSDESSHLTRPEQIANLKNEITSLKHTYQVAISDEKLTSEAVSAELKRFRGQRNEEMKSIVKEYSASLLEWAHAELELWKELKLNLTKN